MNIRKMERRDIQDCKKLVFDNWDWPAADRFKEQAMLSFDTSNPYRPVFYVAETSLGVCGFSAFEPSMLMKDAYHLIWIAVEVDYKSTGIGKALTNCRLEEIKKRGGSMVQLVTQKPGYFEKFGFFKLTPLDNGWWLMMIRLKEIDI